MLLHRQQRRLGFVQVGHGFDHHQVGSRSRARFPGGTLEVRMNIRRERIEDIVFFGDFMATAPLTELCAALRGARRDARELSRILARFPVSSLFGGIREEEILALILNEGD